MPIYLSVGVEANGPCPGIYSMIEIGAVVVEPNMNRFYFTQLEPQDWGRSNITYEPEALQAIGRTHEETLLYPDASDSIVEFFTWVQSLDPKEKVVMVSDNAGFDWQFINYYFHYFCDKNPLGYYARDLTSLYKGLRQDMSANIDNLRDTEHTHNALDDAIGNAEVMLKILHEMGSQ